VPGTAGCGCPAPATPVGEPQPHLGPNGAPALAAATNADRVSSNRFQDDEDSHSWLTSPDGQAGAAGSIAASERVAGKREKAGEGAGPSA
jgi:hypothetical protein